MNNFIKAGHQELPNHLKPILKKVNPNNKSKQDLIDEIKVLEHNLKNKVWENELLIARLEKFSDYLEKQGLTSKEICDIIKLDCERR